MSSNRIRKVSNPSLFTRTYHWIFVDIVDSSDPKLSAKEQAEKIINLTRLLSKTTTFMQRDPQFDFILPTGDGYAIGFSDSPEKPTKLAIELQKLLILYNHSKKKGNKIFVRTGIDSGPVYLLHDLTGKPNVWGPSLNTARRLMDLCEPMNILISDRVAKDLRKLSHDYRNIIHTFGMYELKHNERLHVYGVYGRDYGNKQPPSIPLFNMQGPGIKFYLTSIDVKLRILDQETMLTRHNVSWEIMNSTNEPIREILVPLVGDVPKKIPQLHFSASDEKSQKLDVEKILDKPFNKNFFVKLKNPIKRYQKKKMLNLQYDWEEPNRFFAHTVRSNLRRFKFSLFVPSAMKIKPKLLQVDASGFKTKIYPPPKVIRHREKTEAFWSGSDLPADHSYRFEW